MTENIEYCKKGTIYRQCIVSFVASTIVLTYGLQSGWMSPAITVLQSEASPSGYPLSNSEISLIASFIGFFAIPTGIVFSYVADAIGRRKSLIILTVPQILGFALKLASAHPISLMVSQACCGVACGAVHSVVPMYLKEISQDSLRGVLGSLGLLLQCVGIVIMYAMGAYMNYHTILWIVLWIPFLCLLALFKVPESPAYLMKKGKVEEATEVMAWLRGVSMDHKDVERDISLTRNEMVAHENLPPVSFKSLFATKATRRALGLSFLMIIMLDAGGNYAILAYASVVIRSAGVRAAPDLQAIAFPALMALGTLASAVTVERFGRKPLLIFSVLLTGSPLAVLGSMLLLQQQGGTFSSWVPVVCIGICLFASGQNLPLPYIVMSEMFSVQLRSKVLGLICSCGWLIVAVQTAIFPTAVEIFGMPTIFFFFTSINFLGAVICFWTMPETKGKTLPQIEKELEGLKD